MFNKNILMRWSDVHRHFSTQCILEKKLMPYHNSLFRPFCEIFNPIHYHKQNPLSCIRNYTHLPVVLFLILHPHVLSKGVCFSFLVPVQHAVFFSRAAATPWCLRHLRTVNVCRLWIRLSKWITFAFEYTILWTPKGCLINGYLKSIANPQQPTVTAIAACS